MSHPLFMDREAVYILRTPLPRALLAQQYGVTLDDVLSACAYADQIDDGRPLSRF